MRASFFILAVLVFSLSLFLEDTPETSFSHESETVQCRELIEDLTLKQAAPNKEDLDYRSWINLGDCYAHFWRYKEALSAFKSAYSLQSSAQLLEHITSLEQYLSEEVTTNERNRSFYTLMRNFGPAKHLTGKTVVVYLFVETNQSQWSSLDRQQAISTLEFVQQWYTKQAKDYQLAEPNQAKIHITNIIIGQGVVINNFSNHTKKNNNGSKKFSIASPYFRENNLKLKSIPFLSSIRETRSITGN